MLHRELKERLQEAMRNKETVYVDTLRGLLTACTNELVIQKKKPDTELDDAGVHMVIKKAAKQRKEAIVQYQKAGRTEQEEKEQQELKFLSTYLPEEMSDSALRVIVEEKKKELNIQDPTKMGMLIGAVKKVVGDQADGNRIAEMVRTSLQ